jgi:hypothetical protein
MNGTNYFDVNNWINAFGFGGSWENWSVNNGVFASVVGNAPNCILNDFDFEESKIVVYPNPTQNSIFIEGFSNYDYSIYDYQGKLINAKSSSTSKEINITTFSSGIYFIKIMSEGKISVTKFIKQ